MSKLNSVECYPFVDLRKAWAEMEEDMRCITVENGGVVMRWGQRPEYTVDLNRVKNWAQLVDWMLHLSEKRWMTPYRLRLFSEKVISAKKWKRSDA